MLEIDPYGQTASLSQSQDHLVDQAKYRELHPSNFVLSAYCKDIVSSYMG